MDIHLDIGFSEGYSIMVKKTQGYMKEGGKCDFYTYV